MWSQIKKLLVQTDESTVGKPAVHEPLVRSADHAASHQDWAWSSAASETMSWLLENYESHFNGGKKDRSIAFLDTPSKKGFVLYLTDNNPAINKPAFLMDMIKDRVRELGYTLYTSDVKVYTKGAFVETQQRHYLKPPMEFVPNKKLSQLFGNISIDYLLRDDKPYLFKFSATTYQDHMFEDAGAFEHLMYALLSVR